MPHGYTAMLRYFVITVVLLIGARLALLLLLGAIDRATCGPVPDGAPAHPPVEARLRGLSPAGLRVACAWRST